MLYFKSREFLHIARALGWVGQGQESHSRKLFPSEDSSAGGGLGEECRAVRASKPRRLRDSAETSRNIFFSLIEKIFRGRAKSKNVKKMFLLDTRANASDGGARAYDLVSSYHARSAWSDILFKMSSNFFIQTPPNLIYAIVCLGASRLGTHFVQIIPRFLKGNGQHARREAAVHKRSLYCGKSARADEERFSKIVGVSALPFSNTIL